MPRARVKCENGHWKGRDSSYCRGCGQTYDRTPEHRERMSEALRGKPHTYRSASTTPEVAERIRRAWTPEMREAARLRGLAFAADPEWRRKIAESVSGSKNPMWEDGRAEIPYAPGWGRLHRRLFRESRGNRCEDCGSTEWLDIHHIDGEKHDHSEENLRLLCRRCHKRDHVRILRMRRSLRG
jgi:HNH endonuclease/NUMOD3 motif-containing protein